MRSSTRRESSFRFAAKYYINTRLQRFAGARRNVRPPGEDSYARSKILSEPMDKSLHFFELAGHDGQG